MFLHVLKSKIHRVKVTDANLNYIGSITVDPLLLEAAGILPNEKVQVVNNNNGARIETYAIEGKRGSGEICLNGAAARHFIPGDIVLIIAYAIVTEEEAKTFKPTVIFPDTETNLLKESK
ncbi:MAG: aspartate 1-decarboxylase [Porphyromonas sp.]|nr:aspartate 1-decarboxylase [Bacteroidales bacterium]MDY3101134.1 aspartate 1-decarboxylase [Porphyromonas sp.]